MDVFFEKSCKLFSSGQKVLIASLNKLSAACSASCIRFNSSQEECNLMFD